MTSPSALKAAALLIGALLMAHPSAAGAQTVPEARPPYTRIVSISLMTDEFLLDLVEPGRILALSRSADDPLISNIAGRTQGIGQRVWLNLELLTSLKPDLVLAADWSPAGELDFLRKAGLRVRIVKTPSDWPGVKAVLKDLAPLLSAEERSSRLLQTLEAREKALATAVEATGERPTVLEYNLWGTSGAAGTLWHEITRLAGLSNAAAALKTDTWGFAPLSRETILSLDPDFLIVSEDAFIQAYGSAQAQPDFGRDPLWSRLRAVRSGRLLALPERLKSTASHHLLEAAERLFAMTHSAVP